MKKKLQILSCAIFLGGLLAFIAYKKFLFFTDESPVTKPLAYQIGVYNNYENALKKATNLKGAIIVNQKDSYQVIAAVAKSKENQQRIEQMLNQDQIPFYKKEIPLSKTSLQTVEDYELIMNQTENIDTLKILNQKLLQTLQERMNENVHD